MMSEAAERDRTEEKPHWSGVFSDYPEAVVRIATLRADNVQHFLFGWVELYPFDMRAPQGWTGGAKPWPVPGTRGWSMGFSATRVPTPIAIDWYEKLASGQVNVLVGRPPIPATAIELAPEPEFGGFLVGVDAPFAMQWHDQHRIHRLVPMQRIGGVVWRLRSIWPARAWLKKHLSFDPYEHEEWLGGAALLAPDPLCASFKLIPTKQSAAPERTSAAHLIPRRTADRTADLTSLTLHVAGKRAEGWTHMTSLPVPANGLLNVDYPLPHQQGWALVCKDRGLLRIQRPHPRIEQINFGLSMAGGAARVEVPSGGRRKPAQEYEVATQVSSETTNVGARLPDRPHDRLRDLMARRRLRQRREAAPQRMFGSLPGADHEETERKKKEAQDYVVELVKRARNRLIFVDPYFGIREMRLFALRNEQVAPRILTGYIGLRTLVGETPGFQAQQGLLLIKEIESLRQDLGERTPEVRVMPGQDNSIFHDRYLIVDHEVWHCGPSFNELGDRLGVIVKVPNPEAVRVLIGKVWLLSLTPAEAMAANTRATN